MLERDELREAAIFGREVEIFLGTNLGKYLVQRIEDSFADAIRSLRSADPANPSAVASAQAKADALESMESWLNEAVTAGYQAERALTGESDE